MDIPPWINGNEALRPAILSDGSCMQKELLLVPYSRKSVIKNKKSGGYYKIRMLK
jgi:hypothetical protein